MWKTFFSKILDLFFPVRCINCQKPGGYLCQDCLSIIEVSEEQYCPFCSLPKIVQDGRTCPVCRKKYFLDGLFAAVSFRNKIVKKAIYLFKYSPFIREIAKPLTFLIITHFNLSNNKLKIPEFILVPIPLFRKRRAFRGFNQSEEIAKNLAMALDLPIKNLLIKTKKTQPQTELNKDKRQKNIIGAFQANPQIKEDISGKKILLIDDVFTTGATMNEAAKVLKENGAEEVFGVVIARE